MARTLTGATALEPGGPSALLDRRGPLPVYPLLAALDTLDYSEQTLWSDGIGELAVTPRARLIGEAGRIEAVRDGAYDALLASHVIEHLADPLGALAEWRRVVHPGGHILLVVPHREGTFDHRRPVTSLEHLRADRDRHTGEDDLTHLPEVLRLHDLARDPGAPNREVFEQRCHENASTRAMHHHVFDSRAAVQMCREANLEVLALRAKRPHDVFCLCRVPGSPGDRDPPRQRERRGRNRRAGDGYAVMDDSDLEKTLRGSPFSSDRSSV
jgi:SAM-dependent methyltransferase